MIGQVGQSRRCEDRNGALRKTGHRDERPRARLDWDTLRVFAVVAKAGSVNKAAAELMLQPSSVSRRIEELETKLEAQLFHRRRTGMVLTPAGEDLYDRALSMQHFADDIERSVRGRDRREEGIVTISAPDGVGSLWIAPRIGEFLARNPKIEISLDCQIGPVPPDPENRPDITVALDQSFADVGDDASDLATLHYLFAAAPSYLETYGTPRSIASAAGDHRTLKQTGQVSQRQTWSKRAGAIETLASFSFETNSSAALVAALRGGAGVATMPSYIFTQAPELVVIGGEQSVPIRLWLIIHRESRNATRVLRAAEWLKSIFDGRANPWFREEFISPQEFLAQAPKPPADEQPTAARRSKRGASS
ncbi:MAG: LysR family transcriptional regulator [Hyphomonadaceae bacterium]